MRQIVLDTETTGLSPKAGHRMIEIGCLEMVSRRLTGNNLHLYINPGRSIDAEAQKVHGITEAFLQDKPVFTDIAKQLLDFIRDAELIIHNAPFDVGFLNHEFGLVSRSAKPVSHYCSIVDTLVMAKRLHPGQQNSLDALCRRYHVDNSNRELHGALLDSELLAQVYLLMTGGQTGLFENEPSSKESVMVASEIKRVSSQRPALRTIQPTAEEKFAHEAFLEMLKEN